MSTGDTAHLSEPSRPADRIDARRLLWVGPLVIVVTTVANVVFTILVTRLLGMSEDFPALTPGAIAMFTAIGIVGAVVVFAIVARFARAPISLFRKIALGVLLVSLVPDLLLLVAPPEMRADLLQVIVLMLTHVVAAGVCVWLLERLTRSRRIAASAEST